jgi:5'-3' exonuclease
MSILIDSNQYLISYILGGGGNVVKDVDVDLIKKLFIRQINTYRNMFPNHGNVVLCFDSQHYWRKDIFEYYKFSRKKERQNSDIDWQYIFSKINDIKLKLYDTKYCVMEVDGAEADDIIAILVKYESDQKTIIVSGDKDFDQLLKYEKVSIYNPQKQILKVGDYLP